MLFQNIKNPLDVLRELRKPYILIYLKLKNNS